MRLFLLYFLVGIFLILLQSTFLHLLPFGPVVPDLVLVLCVYLGLHHPTVGAAVGSFVLGYSIDVVSSRLLGLNAFAMTLVFLSVYFSSRTIWLHHPVVSSLDRIVRRSHQGPSAGSGVDRVPEHGGFLAGRG